MTKAQDFIHRHGMDYRGIVVEEQIGRYMEEMENGLNGKPSSLLMLPTYVELKENVRRGERVVCVDAGGTNFRIGVAHFDEKGAFILENEKRMAMPGVERALQAQEFFGTLAEIIAPYLAAAKKIVISFAYRARPTPDVDAEIIEITKEVNVDGADGMLLGAEIKAALRKLGETGAGLMVINDTVASALAGKAERLRAGYGTFTGTILGTGSNSCYVEDNANIGKINCPPGNMMINLESGSYAKFPRTDIDMAYDATTSYPGIGVAEKMSSGGYLGALCGFTLRRAAEEGVFETKAIREARLKSEDVSEYLEHGSGIIEEFMVNGDDEENARKLLHNIVLRAARLVAVQMAAIAEKALKTNNKVCMSIEGSVYEKMFGLKEELHKTLRGYLDGRAIQADLATVERAVMKGCAIAGLTGEG